MPLPAYVRLDTDDDSVVLRSEAPVHSDPIHLNEWTLGYPEARQVSAALIGRSGTRNSTEFHGSSTVDMRLRLRGENRHVMAEQLRRMCGPRSRPVLTVSEPGWGSQRRMELVADGLSYTLGTRAAAYLEVELTFINPLGMMESADEFEFTLTPFSSSAGRTYPREYPWEYEAATGSGPTAVRVDGDAPSKPVFRLYGSQRDPKITNLATGQYLRLAPYTIPSGTYVEIDPCNPLTGGPTILLNGEFHGSVYNALDPTSTWFDLQPGLNYLTASAENASSTSRAIVRYRDYWL